MIVNYKDYVIQFEECRCNLSKKYQAQKIGTGTKSEPNGEYYERETDIAYSMRLDRCLEKIIELEAEEGEDVLTLEQYLERYLKEKEEITEKLNYLLKIKKHGI